MESKNVIFISARADDLSALKAFFENVKADSRAAYIITSAQSADRAVRITEFLRSVAPFPVAAVTENFQVEPNRIYVVPPDKNLSIRGEGIAVLTPSAGELHESQAAERYRTLFDSIDEGFCLIERVAEKQGEPLDFRCLEANQAFTIQSGLSDVVGKTIRQVVPGEPEEWFEIYDRVLRSGEAIRFEHDLVTIGRTLELYAFPVRNAESGFSDQRLAVIFKDITARKQTEEKLRRAAELDAFRVELADALRPLTDAVEIQATIAQTTMNFFAADRCYYSEVEDRNAVIRRDAARGDLPSVAGVYPLDEFPLFKKMMNDGVPLVVGDTNATDLLDEELRRLCVQMKIISFINIPVIKKNRFVGNFCITQSEPRNWADYQTKLAEEIAERTWAAIEHARTEAALRESEERQAFLLQLSDALRPLEEPFAVQREACRLLRLRLGAMRVAWGEMRPDGVTCAVLGEDMAENVASLEGRDWDWNEFDPDGLAALKKSQTIYREDVQAAGDLSPERKATFAALNFRAFINVPLVKSGRLVAFLLVHFEEARQFTPLEIELTEETAERNWAAFERARAEQALQDSEARLQLAVAAAELGTFTWHIAEDRTETDARALAHWGLPPEAEATLAESLAKIFHPEDGQRYVKAIERACDPNGSGTLHEEFRITRDGQERWMSVNATTVFNGTPPAAVRMSGVLADITERKQREANLALLAEVAEDLSVLSAPDEIMQAVGTRLGEFLHVSSCIFADVDEARNEAVIHHGWNSEDVPSLKQTFRLADYFGEEFRRAGRAGETIAVSDTATDSRANAEAYAKLKLGAFVTVPFQRQGRWTANITVTSKDARDWRTDEIELLQEIASRIFPRLERARAEEALRESEGLLRALIENLPGGAVFVLNREMRYLIAEGAALKIAGFTTKDFVGKRLEEALGADLTADYKPLFQRTFAGAPFDYEHNAHGRSFISRGIPLRGANGEIYAVLAVSYDITERKQAEEALHAQQHFTQSIIEAAPMLTYIYDVAQTRNVFVSPQIQTILGYSDTEIAAFGSDLTARLLHPDDAPRIAESFRQVLIENNEEIYEIEYRMRHKDGRWIWLLSRDRIFLRGANGEPAQILGVATDISERKRQEEKLKTANYRFRIAEEAAGGFNYDWNLLTGKITRSSSILNVTGRARGAYEQNWQAWARLVHPDDETVKTEAAALELIRQSKESNFSREYRVRHAAGHFIWVLERGLIVRGDDGEPIRVIGQTVDITERKRTEEALRESEERLRLATDAAEFGVWDWNYQSSVMRWTPQLFKIFGLRPPKDLMATMDTFRPLVHPDDLPVLTEKSRRARKDHASLRCEYRILRADTGELRWVAINEEFFYDEIGEAVRCVGVARDVTARKQSQERVRESEKRYALATEAVKAVIYDWNITEDTIIRSAELVNLLGFSPDEPETQSNRWWKTRVHPDDARRAVRFVRAKINSNAARFSDEYRMIHRDGSTVWVSDTGVFLRDENGTAYRCVGSVTDISRRKRAEMNLRDSEERLRLIIESASEYAILTIKLDGTIDSWSAGAEKTFGYTNEEIIGQPSESLFTEADCRRDVPAKERRAALKHGRASDDRWHVRKDGSKFLSSGVVMPIIKNGQPDGFVKIARDMTEKLAAEKARSDREILQKLVGALEDERRRIARDLHDELGQKLTAMRFKLEAVRKICEDEQICGGIDEAQRLAKQIDDGVDFLAWELRPAALDDLGLPAALKIYADEWSRFAGITTEVRLAKLSKTRLAPEIETNLYRITQEALNNIHKHSKARRAGISLDKRGDLVVLIIEDNGKGFNVESKKNRNKGIGLIGMQERAALVGGSVEIESAPRQGTTIFVRVPARFSEQEEIK